MCVCFFLCMCACCMFVLPFHMHMLSNLIYFSFVSYFFTTLGMLQVFVCRSPFSDTALKYYKVHHLDKVHAWSWAIWIWKWKYVLFRIFYFLLLYSESNSFEIFPFNLFWNVMSKQVFSFYYFYWNLSLNWNNYISESLKKIDD